VEGAFSEVEPSRRSTTVTVIRLSPGCVRSDGRESVEEEEEEEEEKV
jgi:hypothetical protein